MAVLKRVSDKLMETETFGFEIDGEIEIPSGVTWLKNSSGNFHGFKLSNGEEIILQVVKVDKSGTRVPIEYNHLEIFNLPDYRDCDE